MKAIRIKVKADKDGELVLHDLPIHKDDIFEVILMKEKEVKPLGKKIVSEDPVLKLCGLGKDIWKGIDPDLYVKNIREGWE